MPLEAAMVFQQDIFNYNGKDVYNLLGGNLSFGDHDHFGTTTTTTTIEKEDHDDCKVFSFDFLENQPEKVDHYGNWTTTTTTYSPPKPPPQPCSMVPHLNEWDYNYYQNHCNNPDDSAAADDRSTPVDSAILPFDNSTISLVRTRRSRRSRRRRKSEDEIENQRMTHIAVERNRRKQMNEYLSVLRSVMPASYVQRGNQASIIGGAIDFVKELEQRLQWLVGEKQEKGKSEINESLSLLSPFSEFFTFPQYYSTSGSSSDSGTVPVGMSEINPTAENKSAIADIEVTMVESHANLKIQSRKRVPKQLLKMVTGLQCLGLTILHLNVTTVDHIVLYCLSVKVEDDCKLTSVEEIATAVHEILDRVQEERL